MGDVFVALFIAASGFAAAGILGSFYHLVTGQPPQFFGEISGPASTIVAIALWLIAGPFMFMRFAIQGYFRETFQPAMLAVAGGLAAMWSVCSGIFVLSFLLAF